jgi:hypothetical protein
MTALACSSVESISLVSGTDWTTLVLHASRCGARGSVLVCLLPLSGHERMDALAMKQLALSILVKPRAIAVQF